MIRRAPPAPHAGAPVQEPVLTAKTDKDLVEVVDVVKRYGSVHALDHVSLSIRQGEFLALLGPSGCGKTTLLRTLAGFVEPDEGKILIDGQDIARTPPNRRPVNTVFQNYALFPHLTVAENIAFGPKRAKWPAARIAEEVGKVLALASLEALGDRRPNQLSGGQQQRVALARALINQPKVLLLDEPLGALDLKLRKRMQLELKQIQHGLGITFIFVTHDQEEALTMADRIAVMNQGKVIQFGGGQEIYKNPASQFVASFIGDANLVKYDDSEGRLMVRPEDVRLGAAPSDAFNSLTMRVTQTLFLGTSFRVFGQMPNGDEFVAQLPSHPETPPPAEAETVTVHWPRDRERTLAA